MNNEWGGAGIEVIEIQNIRHVIVMEHYLYVF